MNGATQAAGITWDHTTPELGAGYLDDDFQGHLILEAHLIVSGESDQAPTVEHLDALLSECHALHAIIAEQRSGQFNEECPF